MPVAAAARLVEEHDTSAGSVRPGVAEEISDTMSRAHTPPIVAPLQDMWEGMRADVVEAAVGILEPAPLAGYRTDPVYIQNAHASAGAPHHPFEPACRHTRGEGLVRLASSPNGPRDSRRESPDARHSVSLMALEVIGIVWA